MNSGMQRRLILSCVAVTVLTAMFLADRHYRAGLEQQNRQALIGAAESAAARLAHTLRLPTQGLHVLGALLSVARGPVDYHEFEVLAAALRVNYPGLRGVAYAAPGVRHAYVLPGDGEVLVQELLQSEAGAREEAELALVAAPGSVATPDGAVLLTARQPLSLEQGFSTVVVGVFDVSQLIQEALAGRGRDVWLQLRDASGTVFWGAPFPDGMEYRAAVAAPKGDWTLALAQQDPPVRLSMFVLVGIWGLGGCSLLGLLFVAKRPAFAAQGNESRISCEQGHGAHANAAASPTTADIGAELEAFTYSVSHDLRAPLRAVQGFAGALLEDCGEQLTPVGRDYARRIVKAGRRMDGLIEDLLAYSRITRREIRLRNVDLERVVRDVLDHELAGELRACNADVEVKSPLPEVMGHYATLVKIVGNLVANAIKFVSAGQHPRVRIWAEHISMDAPSPMVRLWVEDNGIGIATEKQQQIFKVFERLHGIESYPGSGIGLAIVRHGVERLGGHVGLESSPGKGSRFWIALAIADDSWGP